MSFRTHISETSLPNVAKLYMDVSGGRGWVVLWRRCDTVCTPVLPVLRVT